MISRWIGVSRVKPVVTRFRTADGDYGLRIMCWHSKVGEVAYPHRATVESWEQGASLNPCRWVEACPRFAELQVFPDQRRDRGFVNLVRSDRITVAAERRRRRGTG